MPKAKAEPKAKPKAKRVLISPALSHETSRNTFRVRYLDPEGAVASRGFHYDKSSTNIEATRQEAIAYLDELKGVE